MLRLIKSDEGVLTFEWILLITILAIGVIAGLSAVRDALGVELADVAQAVGSVDESLYFYGVETSVQHGVGVQNETFISFHDTCGSELFDGLTIVTIDDKAVENFVPAGTETGRDIPNTSGM